MNIYYYFKNRMNRRAMFFGIAAIVLSFMYMPYFSIPAGCFAIMFAFLGKGNSYNLTKEGKIAIVTGLLGVSVAVIMTVKVYTAFISNTEYRNNVIEAAELLYGDDFEEIYGQSFSDIVNDLFPEVK